MQWLKSLSRLARASRASRARAARNPSKLRLLLERLETRDLPAAFTYGDLVVYRAGDGVAVAGGAGAKVFLDELSPTTAAQSAPVQSVALPTTGTSGRLVGTTNATAEGQL